MVSKKALECVYPFNRAKLIQNAAQPDEAVGRMLKSQRQ